MKQKILQMMFAAFVCAGAHAQVNSGSNGSDGAFNPATNTVVNMADHPNGIYQYTSVTISNGVTVTFIPNANNTPVTWLVQSNCEIDGTVDVSGQSCYGSKGGPGGWAGGNSGSNPSPGQGPGGGQVGFPYNNLGTYGGQASFGTVGDQAGTNQYSNGQASPGNIYGNNLLIPLLGGSGGGGGSGDNGAGGGGAILIAANSQINIAGSILANGGGGAIPINSYYSSGAGGSGGAIRLISPNILGGGTLSASGGMGYGGGYLGYWGWNSDLDYAGNGRIRLDTFQNGFSGNTVGTFSEGFQPIIIPVAGQSVQLSIASVAGASVSATPTGQPITPDAIISGQQANPIPIVVSCSNLPLNTLITVTVTPANGSPVSAVGYNTTGTLASSTATVSLTMPRGGGIIYATAATSN